MTAVAGENEVTTRCRWCGWATTGVVSRTADEFARHVAECNAIPEGIAARLAQARERRRARPPSQGERQRRGKAERAQRAKQLHAEGLIPEDIASQLGVKIYVVRGYLRDD